MQFRTLQDSDVASIARLHAIALPDDVLPSLGIQILTEYYRWAVYASDQHLLGLMNGSELVGFCQLSFARIQYPSVFSGRFLWSLIRLAFKRPGVFLAGILQWWHYKDVTGDTAEIAFIAIHPARRGAGMGKSLIDVAMKYCQLRDKHFMQTKTSNKRLVTFYIRNYDAEVLRTFRVMHSSFSILRWPCRV